MGGAAMKEALSHRGSVFSPESAERSSCDGAGDQTGRKLCRASQVKRRIFGAPRGQNRGHGIETEGEGRWQNPE